MSSNCHNLLLGLRTVPDPSELQTEHPQELNMAITHIVHFAYNCNEDTKKQIASRFLALKDQCVSKTSGKPYILSLIGGKNNSPEGMNDGLEVSKHASAIAVAVAVAVCCP